MFIFILVSVVDFGNLLLIFGVEIIKLIIIRVLVDVEVGNYFLFWFGFEVFFVEGVVI